MNNDDNDISRITSNDGILNHVASIAEDVPEASVGAETREDEIARGGGTKRRKQEKSQSYSHTHFKVYKRRWFGLAQLCLLNIVVSWDVSSILTQLGCARHTNGTKYRTRWRRT
jgi:FLVCR family MFS transporter 7